MKFCPKYNDLTTGIWQNDGLSRCFYDTIASSILLGILLIFGIFEIFQYIKYAVLIDNLTITRKRLYKLFQLVILLSIFECFIRLLLQYQYKKLYAYSIFYNVSFIFCWLFTYILLYYERNCRLMGNSKDRHGILLLIFWTIVVIERLLALISWSSDDWWFKSLSTNYMKSELILWVFRLIFASLILFIGFLAPGIPSLESLRLAAGMGSSTDEEALIGDSKKPSNSLSTWKGLLKKMRTLFPYIWPKRNLKLQICVVFCIILLIIGRVVNLYNPIYYKLIVDSLSVDANSLHPNATILHFNNNNIQIHTLKFRWDYICIYVFLRFLQGGGFGTMGLLNNLRTLVWIWVQQFTTRETEVSLFKHLHSLSLRWHLGRKTGEVLRVMDRGTNSINNLLSYIVFQIIPTFVDIIIAIVYFLTAFNIWFALIVFITMVIYLIATIYITEWRTKFRREMNQLDNERNAKGVDSLLNFETVKYYGAEEFEVNRYRDSFVIYQKSEWISNATLSILNSIQNVIITIGLLAGCLLCAWYVVDGKGLTVGDYVLFSAYLVQLYAPLNWFGTYYRMIQQAFIDMENMFDLLEEKQEVKDNSDAETFLVVNGGIEFDNVSFHYVPEKAILKNVSFTVAPGKSVGIVGPSGAGKSTIIRLLFRFYDVINGTIRIDGKNVKSMTQASLRKAIGVVPQDTVLFNDDIRYNIRYGRVNATDEEIEDAARYADIHDKILSFPQQYETKVGERGLKLSGGEKQRVAIARTILKAPSIVLLDEATSALDTHTERNIQASLAKICENRTSLVVAHRLSTIINCDNILVFKDGCIIEEGNHQNLLELHGEYWNMWQEQITQKEEN